MQTKKLCFLLLMLSTSVLFPQQYTEIFDNVWGMGINYSAPVFCDIDQDGLLDLIVGSQDGKLGHYRQNSAGSSEFDRVTSFFNEIDVGEFAVPFFIDLDQDGLLDLFIGHQYGRICHFEQQAVHSLEFNLITDQFNGIKVPYESVPSFTDLDHDGRLDLIVGERANILHHYEQTAPAAQTFTLIADTLSGIVTGWRPRPVFLDLDGDGLLDLIIGNLGGKLLHYEQDAAASFTFSLLAAEFSEIRVDKDSAPAFADFNGDGLLDLIVGELAGHLNHFVQNAAKANSFALVSERFVNGSIDVGLDAAPAFGDLDGDGRLDLLIGTESGVVHHYEQDAVGSSGFHPLSAKFNDINVGNLCAPILTELNHNGRYDLILGKLDGFLIYYEQQAVNSTAFQHVTDSLSGIDAGSYSSPCAIDLDGDGLLDLVVGEYEGCLRHYEQAGVGSTDFVWISDKLGGIDVGEQASPCFTDLDGDGLWDLLVGSNTSRVYHYEQEAAGSTSFAFFAEYFNDVYISSAKPIFADVNGDGLQDYLAGSYYGDIHYFQRIDGTQVEPHLLTTIPRSFALGHNYPNPFNPATTIPYDLGESAQIEISIFNVRGQRVKELLDAFQPAGSYAIRWDGKDEKGRALAGGIYFLRMQAGQSQQSVKLVLLP